MNKRTSNRVSKDNHKGLILSSKDYRPTRNRQPRCASTLSNAQFVRVYGVPGKSQSAKFALA